MTNRIISIILLILVFPIFCAAATYVVDQGGGGDYTTINGAIAIAGDSDRIEVMPGTYAEACMITVGLELVGVGGASATILDGVGAQRIMMIDNAIGCTVRGFTFINGHSDDGSAIHVTTQAVATVEDCIFEDNNSSWTGGAIYTCMIGTQLDVSGCLFTNNFAVRGGGAININTSSQATISNCEFRDNTSDMGCGGVVNGADSDISVTECLFVGNSGVIAGALRSGYATAQITRCTIHDNLASNGASVVLEGASFVFEYNIVTNESLTRCFYAERGIHDYNIFCGQGGESAGQPLSANEWYVDPGYCNFPAGNFTLCSTSIALPENNGFGLIGLYGMGCSDCGPVETQDASWGDIKALFR